MWWWFSTTDTKVDELTAKVAELQKAVDRITFFLCRPSPAETFFEKKYINGVCDKCRCRRANECCATPDALPVPEGLDRQTTLGAAAPPPTPTDCGGGEGS